MLHAKTPVHHRGMITTPGQLHHPLYPLNLPGSHLHGDGPAWHWVLWPKSLTLPTSRGHTDLVRKMPTGSQLRLLLRLMVILCLLYPLPFIYLEPSRKLKSVVSNC